MYAQYLQSNRSHRRGFYTFSHLDPSVSWLACITVHMYCQKSEHAKYFRTLNTEDYLLQRWLDNRLVIPVCCILLVLIYEISV